MAVFTSQFRQLAHGALNWDTQLDADLGALETLLNGYPALASGGWSPQITGTGAAVGGSASAGGTWQKVGGLYTLVGWINFGSSASWGTDTAAITNLPLTFDQYQVIGSGAYTPNGGSAVPITLTSAAGNTLAVRPHRPADPTYLGIGRDLGSIAQASQLAFSIVAKAA